MNHQPKKEIVEYYRNWLGDFESWRLHDWNKRYKSQEKIESALMEAYVCWWLKKQGCDVKPNEDRGLGGVDFVCENDGNDFYVEVTCIKVKTVVDEIKIPELPTTGFSLIPINSKIQEKARHKAGQCGDLDSPCLLAIGTMHFTAAASCLNDMFVEMILTGGQYRRIDIQSGEDLGEYANFRSSSFHRVYDGYLQSMRQSISGLLLFGILPYPSQWVIKGVWHEGAVRPFDHQLLDSVPFCNLVKYEDYVSVEWFNRTDHQRDT